jgi:hypothetical protein
MQQRLDQEILFLEYSDESQYSFLCGSFVVNVVLMFFSDRETATSEQPKPVPRGLRFPRFHSQTQPVPPPSLHTTISQSGYRRHATVGSAA